MCAHEGVLSNPMNRAKINEILLSKKTKQTKHKHAHVQISLLDDEKHAAEKSILTRHAWSWQVQNDQMKNVKGIFADVKTPKMLTNLLDKQRQGLVNLFEYFTRLLF